MQRLAGIDLIVPTQQIIEWTDRYFDPSMFVPWLRRSWPGFGLVGLAYPTGLRDVWIDYRQVKLNRFYWPTGAMRWAFGHFVASKVQVEFIRLAAYGEDGTEMNEVPFTLSCPGQDSPEILETNLFVLACTPIGGLTGYDNANPPYIVTVVDDRYWWAQKSTPKLEIDDTTTWTSLFETISTALGTEITVDEIASQYLQPSPSMNLSYEYLSVFLDAMCYNVGHRLVRGYDGSVVTMSFATSLEFLQADFEAFPNRAVKGGGSRYLDIP